MDNVVNKMARLAAAEYIERYRDADRFIGFCEQCGNYGTMWVCPPYGFDTLARIKEYRNVYIIGTKVPIDESTRHAPADRDELENISHRIMKDAREIMDALLLRLEERHKGSLAFFAGSCYLCPEGGCTRKNGDACLHPAKARSSLEAYGFDISKTASELLCIELKWSDGLLLPEYFTLVSALFTDHEIEGIYLR